MNHGVNTTMNIDSEEYSFWKKIIIFKNVICHILKYKVAALEMCYQSTFSALIDRIYIANSNLQNPPFGASAQ